MSELASFDCSFLVFVLFCFLFVFVCLFVFCFPVGCLLHSGALAHRKIHSSSSSSSSDDDDDDDSH